MHKELVIGIDMGGTNMRMALVDDRGKIVHQARESTRVGAGAEDVSLRLSQGCRALMDYASQKGSRVKAVGLGVAGKIDHVRGKVLFSPNLRDLNDYPLASELHATLKIPVVMENDANAFGVGEHWIADRHISNWVGLTLGTGVGGCLIFENRLWHGDNLGFVGEIGHMIVQPGGPPCGCGKRGCLEAHSSASALLRGVPDAVEAGELTSGSLYEQWKAGALTAKGIYEQAEQGNALARQLFDRMGWALGIAVSNLFTVLGIRHAVIGGGVSASWNQFIEPLKKSLAEHNSMLDAEEMVILKSKLQDDAALLGAARLAFEL